MKVGEFAKFAYVQIDLDPFTGWGNYGKQLCQHLVSEGIAFPLTPCDGSVTGSCELPWVWLVSEIYKRSNGVLSSFLPEMSVESGLYDFAFEPFGNEFLPRPLLGRFNVATGFFEKSTFSADEISFLRGFDLVVTGSSWNRSVLRRHGIPGVKFVMQGVDTSRFNPSPTPRVLQSPFIVFSGGKLEIRKGQDIVIAAFREFLKICPEALMICCWSVAEGFSQAFDDSVHVDCVSDLESRADVKKWIVQNGIPEDNFILVDHLSAAQIPSLIKQADVAVFPNRCEGGTNLVAMEALCCGLPVLLSACNGHLDLMRMGFGNLIPLRSASCVSHVSRMSDFYGADPLVVWGECSVGEIIEKFRGLCEAKGYGNSLRWPVPDHILGGMSWENSFKKFFKYLK